VVTRALLLPTDTWEIWACLLASAATGYHLNKTPIGGALSGPVCAMLSGALLANAGVLPPPGPHFTAIQTGVVSLATPLLLLGADLRVVFTRTRRLVGAFGLGSLATVLGAVVAFAALESTTHCMSGMGSNGDGWKVAAALAAKNIGGGINYVAVANTLGLSPEALAAGITADNFFALVYFPIVSWLGGDPRTVGDSPTGAQSTAGAVNEENYAPPSTRKATWRSADDGDEIETWMTVDEEPRGDAADQALSQKTESHKNPTPSVGDMATVLATACAVVAIAGRIAPPELGILPTETLIAVAFATLCPSGWNDRLRPAGDLLGNLLLFIFFASAGAAGGAITSVFAYPALFAFLAVLYFVHICAMLAVSRWKGLGLTREEVLVASNANVGGPATAGALAAGKNWTELIVPAMLVGNFGNAVGTFLGLGLSKVFYMLSW
tara:strand:- start:2767 stop:4080 length:1314 start_codon:yes stop_codon:yes gene_type:complete